MKNIFFLISFFLLTFFTNAQIEKPPVYPGCEGLDISQLEACFYSHLKSDVYSKFNTPKNVRNDRFKGKINVAFVITEEGKFKIIYVNR